MNGTNTGKAKTAAKFKVAGYGFLLLNVTHALLGWRYLPPFASGLPKETVWLGVILVVLLLFPIILKGYKRWAQVLAVIFFLRSAVTGYLLATSETLPVVPYLFLCLVTSFYLLGRAGWDWP